MSASSFPPCQPTEGPYSAASTAVDPVPHARPGSAAARHHFAWHPHPARAGSSASSTPLQHPPAVRRPGSCTSHHSFGQSARSRYGPSSSRSISRAACRADRDRDCDASAWTSMSSDRFIAVSSTTRCGSQAVMCAASVGRISAATGPASPATVETSPHRPGTSGPSHRMRRPTLYAAQPRTEPADSCRRLRRWTACHHPDPQTRPSGNLTGDQSRCVPRRRRAPWSAMLSDLDHHNFVAGPDRARGHQVRHDGDATCRPPGDTAR